MDKKTKEIFLAVAEASLPEILDFIPKVIPGVFGMVLPSIGRIYLECRDKIKSQEQMNELKERIEKLEVTEKKQVEETLRKLMKDMANELESTYVEIYVIDGFYVLLKEVEDIRNCFDALSDEVECNGTILNQLVNSILLLNNEIVFNLKEHSCREELDELIDEIRRIIIDTRDVSWGEVIKMIRFF